jgi:hypothetical protein
MPRLKWVAGLLKLLTFQEVEQRYINQAYEDVEMRDIEEDEEEEEEEEEEDEASGE